MDNAATTKVRPEALDAMLPYLRYRYANPSGIYSFSTDVRSDINSARRQLAYSINADEDEIYITSGGTESDNWALKMAVDEHKGGHIITTKIEHHAILRSCEMLEKHGVSVTYLPTDEHGKVKREVLEKAIRPNTCLISIMAANNEIGTIEPLQEFAHIASEYNILFHTDAVQAYTNIPIDVKAMNINMLSTSAHKIHGPKGIGFLYIKKGCLKTPFINGGSQESGMRAGTENVAGIIGFAKASDIALANMEKRVAKEIRMRDYMIERVLHEIPYAKLNGHEKDRLPNNMNFSFRYIDGATLIVMLDKQGICASAGSACSSGSKESSHVLKAIGLDDSLAHATVRFTINEDITPRELDYTIHCLKNNINQLRDLSEEYKALNE
jgi:cysteine desulfurase